jgi:hypothetical protein
MPQLNLTSQVNKCEHGVSPSPLWTAIIESQKEKWGYDMRKVLELHSPASCNQLMNYSVKKAPEQRMSFMGGGSKSASSGSDFGEDVSPEVHPLFANGGALHVGIKLTHDP